MANAPSTRDSTDPPDLPTTLAEQLNELHFAVEDCNREDTFEELCREHPDWAATMREYRAAMVAGERIMGRATGGVANTPVAPQPIPERIGAYRIQEVIGEGGFGVVYRAEQSEPVRRTVALKVLRAGRFDERSRLRFEAERQTLARMQHAGIAQVFDGGKTDEGLQYLAMEFVDGLPLTTWCDRHRLDIPDRLDLFLRVCAAVQHAHQRGVVHRDLKPSNVLVRAEEDRATAKIIDFGVAKLLLEEERDNGVVTREGALIGTPGYMSPEQAAGSPIDTRTDVYALGVLLYELLAGDIPFSRDRLATSNVAEVLRILREEDPQRLSTAVRRADDAADLIAARRGCRIDGLMKALRGDLEWVVRKALAKDPDQRYASVSALIHDVQCFLRNEPVSAREPAAVYVLRKFVARHRLGVGVGLASVAVAAVGIVVLLWLLGEVEEQRQVAVTHSRVADEQRDVAVLNEYHAHLVAAQAALQVGRAASARRHLMKAAAEHRGWEWRYLAAQCDTSLTTLDGEDIVSQVKWLDDDRLLVCYYRKGAQIRNVRTGEVEQEIPLGAEVHQGIYDRANDRLIVMVTLQMIEVWNGPRWERPSQRLPFSDDVRSMALAPDGRTLATSDNSGAVRFTDLDAEHDARVFCDAETYASSLEFFADGERLAVALADGHVRIHDVATGAVVRTLSTAPGHTAMAIVGDTLFTASRRKLHAWDTRTGAVLASGSSREDLGRLRLSVDGQTLYGGGGFGAVEVSAWDATTLDVVGRYHGHQSGGISIDVHPDGTRIVTGSRDGSVRVWPAAARPPLQRLQAGFDARQLSVAPDGRAFACADINGRVTVWDAESLQETGRFETHEPHGGCALGSQYVYAAGRTLLAIDRTSGDISVADAPGVAVSGLVIDDLESWLVGSSESGRRLLIWQLPELRLVHTLACPTRPHVAFDPGRQLFVVGCTDGELRLVDAELGAVVATMSVPDVMFNVAVSGPHVVIASEQLHMLGGGTTRDRWSAHGVGTFGVAFSPDGKRLATGGADALVRLWNLDGEELLVLEGRRSPIIHTRFAAGGRRLLGLSHKWSSPTEVLVWDAPPQVELAK